MSFANTKKPILSFSLCSAIAGVMLAASVSGSAASDAYNPENLPADQYAKVQYACEHVLDLQNDYDDYSCLGRMSSVLLGQQASQQPTALLEKVGLETTSATSLHRKVEKACASIGIDPNDHAFGRCVNDVEFGFSTDRMGN